MKKIIWIALWMLAVSQLSAQTESVRAVILINGRPVLADITPKGEVIATITELKDYFTSSLSTEKIIAQYNGQTQPQTSSEQIAFYPKETEPEVPFTTENQKPIQVGLSQYLGFSPGRALLKDAAVDQIRQIADSYRAGSIDQILIYSYHDRSYKSKALARNRAEGIKSLLGAYGVRFQRIDVLISPRSADTRQNFVRVSF